MVEYWPSHVKLRFDPQHFKNKRATRKIGCYFMSENFTQQTLKKTVRPTGYNPSQVFINRDVYTPQKACLKKKNENSASSVPWVAGKGKGREGGNPKASSWPKASLRAGQRLRRHTTGSAFRSQGHHARWSKCTHGEAWARGLLRWLSEFTHGVRSNQCKGKRGSRAWEHRTRAPSPRAPKSPRGNRGTGGSPGAGVGWGATRRPQPRAARSSAEAAHRVPRPRPRSPAR